MRNKIVVYPILGVILLLLFLLKANAQNYNISFAATGMGLTIDSVYVENLTQGTKAKLVTGDSLHLIVSTDIEDFRLNDNLLQIYPNPMQGQTDVLFFAKQSGNVQIRIIDVSGKEIIYKTDKISEGFQKYKLNGLMQGLYLLNIKGDNYSYSAKIISQNTTHCEAKIYLTESEQQTVNNNKFKTSKSLLTMAYTSGDRILYKGFSGNYRTIFTHIPTANTTVLFNFLACNDASNNYYSIVQIGTQIWMAENLKTTKYINGIDIQNVTNNGNWATLVSGAYCNYNNDSSNSAIYGKLYNFYAISDTGKICPVNWHVPNNTEWTTLQTYLGGDIIAGGKLKETGLIHWKTPNTNATNETGFTALPGGYRYDGAFYNILNNGYWWSSTIDISGLPTNRFLWYNHSDLTTNNAQKYSGFSVRCLKD
ncbi:MAG: FISUMP domain-containing protein [Bacteroidales bacterium]